MEHDDSFCDGCGSPCAPGELTRSEDGTQQLCSNCQSGGAVGAEHPDTAPLGFADEEGQGSGVDYSNF